MMNTLLYLLVVCGGFWLLEKHSQLSLLWFLLNGVTMYVITYLLGVNLAISLLAVGFFFAIWWISYEFRFLRDPLYGEAVVFRHMKGG